MALSYRLYQIGRKLDSPSNVSGISDSNTDTQSSLDDFHTGGTTYWQVDVGDQTVFPTSDFFYVLIENEVMAATRADEINGLSGDKLAIWSRGLFGTKTETHSSGKDIYTFSVDPSTTLTNEVIILDEVNDFDVIEVGKSEEAIEHKKGNFRINNANVTVRGIDRHRLNEAGSIQKPWVFEVYDSSDSLLFQGLIQEDIKYNASTQKINFQALSWLDILNQVDSLPARLIFESDVVGKTVNENKNRDLPPLIELTIDDSRDKLPTGFPTAGDTIAIETGVGEVRRLINGVEDQNTSQPVVKFEASDKNELELFDSRNHSNTGLNATKTSADTIQQLAHFIYYEVKTQAAKNAILKIGNKEGYKILTFDSNDEIVQKIPIDKSAVRSVRKSDDWPKVFYAEQAYSDRTSTTELESFSYYIITRRSSEHGLFNRFGEINDGDTIRLLGREAWGYSGFPAENFAIPFPENYRPDTLIDAMLTVNDESGGQQLLGILPEIYGSTSFEFGGLSDIYEEIDPRIEFPDSPIDSLRMIQQDTGLLLVEDTGIQQNSNNKDIPLVDYKLLPRDEMFDSTNQTSLDNIVSWKEDVTEEKIQSVVVTTNEQYAGGGNRPKVAGWYYDSIEEDEKTDKPEHTTKPSGERVVEIKTNTFPSHTGVVYTGGSEPVRNDDKLKEIAKKFYEHFKKANRSVEIEVGRNDPDVLGKYVSFNEGPVVNDSVLITNKTYDLRENHFSTTLKGRIGGRAVDATTVPNAVIQGKKDYYADSNDDVQIVLNGSNSWDASRGTLSYQWKYRKKGSTTSWDLGNSNVNDGGTEVQFDETITGVTSRTRYEIRLEVTNSNTSTTGTTVKTIVLEPRYDVQEETYSNEVDYDKTQVTKSSTRYGRLEITPKIIPNIKTGDPDGDGNDEFLVEFIAAKGKEVDVDTSKDSNWVAVGETDSSDPYSGISDSTELTDSNGNVTGFRIDVELAKKHVSNILTRIQWVDPSGFQNQRRAWAFDFDTVAEVDNLNVYTNSDGDLLCDVSVDEDTDEYLVEYAVNDPDGSGGWTTVTNANSDNKFTSDQQSLDTTANLSDGDSGTVRISPENADDVIGKRERKTTYFGQTSGGSTFDSVTISGGGTIDSVNTDEIRFRDTGGNPATLTNINSIQNSTGGEYANLAENETVTANWTYNNNLTLGDGSLADTTAILTFDIHRKFVWERIGNTASTASLSLRSEANNPVQIVDTNRGSVLYVNTNDKRVGVSNNTPSYPLDVSGTAHFSTKALTREYRFTDEDSSGGNYRWVVISNDSRLQLDHTNAFGTDFISIDHTVPEMHTDVNFGFGGETSPSYELEVSGRIGRNYTSGALGSGYIIDDDIGNGRTFFEVDNLRVRGSLFANTFVKDKVRAQNGFVFFTSSTKFTEDVTTPGSTGSSNTFTAYVEENVFVAGDRIWYKDISSDDSLTVNSVELVVDTVVGSTTRNGETVYELTLYVNNTAGTSTTLKGGGTVVRIGSSDTSNQGSVFVDSESTYSPFIDIYDGVASWADFQSESKLKARIGNIGGAYDYSGSDVYGLAAGDPNSDFISVDATNGIRLVDNNSGSNTVRTQLTGGSLTLGSTSENHAKIDSTSLKLISSGGKTTAELNGSTLTVGVASNDHAVLDGTSLKLKNSSGNISAELNGSTLTLGITSNDHTVLDGTSLKFKNSNGNVAGELNGSTLTLGVTTNDHTVLDGTSLKMKGSGGTVRAELNGSVLTLGDTSSAHVKIDPSANGLEFIRSDGVTVIQADTSGSAFIENTLQMGAGSLIKMNNQGRIEIDDGSELFTVGPIATTEKDFGFFSSDLSISTSGGPDDSSQTVSDSDGETQSSAQVDDFSDWEVTVTFAYTLDEGTASDSDANMTVRVIPEDSNGNSTGGPFTKSDNGDTGGEVEDTISFTAPSGTKQFRIEREVEATDSTSTSSAEVRGTGNYIDLKAKSADDFIGPSGWIYRNSGGTLTGEFQAATGDLELGGTLTENSDARTKNIKGRITDAPFILKKVRGVRYKRTDMERPQEAGPVAQDFVNMFDEAVRRTTSGYAYVPSAVQGLLIEGWRDHEERISSLEQKLN